MKTQNTLENKARFFALYWGQEVLRFEFVDKNSPHSQNALVDEHLYPEWVTQRYNKWTIENGYLELISISQITDEDAKEITTICEEKYILSRGTKDGFRIETASSLSGDNQDRSIYYSKDGIVLFYNDGNWGGSGYKVVNTLKIYDYLRSKGYALPWMDLSVEDLVEYGWVKLKEESV